MPYLTEAQLNSIVDTPVSLPITDLHPQEWLVISSALIGGNQTLTLRWLQGYILSADDPAAINTSDGSVIVTPDSTGQCIFPPQAPQLIVPNLGIAFIGLYRDFKPLSSPAFQSPQEQLLLIGDVTSVPPVSAVRTLVPTSFSTPGTYSFVICNNTSNRLLRVVANGALRVNLGFPSS